MASHTLKLPNRGPFRADQLHDGDPYELSYGHPIRCMGAGDRHGTANEEGAKVIGTDPAVERAGLDTGYAFNDGLNLRAPDIAVGGLEGKPGWAQGVPRLAVEYADRGQDERELMDKINEFLSAGTEYVWVVRLQGPLRVEVHRPGQRVQTVDADGELVAPGVLQNPVPVRALVDGEASNQATLRNLLNRLGYRDLDDVQARVLRQAVYDLCEVLNIELTPPRRDAIDQMDKAALQDLRAHLKSKRAWPA